MTDYYRYGRRRSGIRHELKQVIKHWLKSIDDKEVRKRAKKDVIVTGGCIASMLLGEKVNDFDLYFRTKKTAAVVAQYYVQKFNDANPPEKRDGIDYTPTVQAYDDRVKIHMQSAGIVGEDQKSYEYLEFQPDAAQEFMATLLQEKKKSRGKYRPVCMTDNAISLSNDIQIVVRFFGEPDEIHKNYDFVHCTCSWDHDNEVLSLPAPALESLLSRTLVYQGSLYPVASIFRLRKFLYRGWRINAGNMLKIMTQISALNLCNLDILQEQLIGVDMAYMHEILVAIKDANPEKIDSTYINQLVDQIFDD